MRRLSPMLAAPLLLGVLATPVASQSVSQSASERTGAYVQMGAAWSGLVDRNSSALRYQGGGVGPATGWRGIYDTYRVEVDLAVSASRLSSRITSGDLNRESAVSVDVRLAVLRRLAPTSDAELSLFAGGQILVNALGRSHRFPHGATENFADIFGTLGAVGMWEYRLAGATTVGGALALPVASVVGRTPYYGLKDAPDFGFRGPMSLSTVTHALWVERPIASRVTLLVDYRTTFQRDRQPRPFQRVEHWLGTGLGLHRRAP